MQKTSPKVLWHKCNSILTFMKAVLMDVEGLAGIEFDVVASKDGVPVLFHDRIIKKDGVEVEVSELSLEELLKDSPHITTLEAALESVNHIDFSDSFEFHLEVKPDDVNVTHKILKVLKDFPKINAQTTIRSFQPDVLLQVKAISNRPVCLILGEKHDLDIATEFKGSRDKTALSALPVKIEEIIDITGGYKPEQISVNHNLYSQEFAELAKNNNIELEIHTVNDIRSLDERHLNRLVTDEPYIILEKLKDRDSLISNVS